MQESNIVRLGCRGTTSPAWTAIRMFHAARAELLARIGRADEARTAYRAALALPQNDAQRRHLRRRLAACAPPVE